jgi:uncharacterized protein
MDPNQPPLTCPDRIERGQRLRVRNLDRGTVLVERLALALSPLSRLRGLLARPPLEEEEGMLISPCASVHTFFMGFPIDVLFLDGEGIVLEAREHLAPFRATAFVRGARSVLELRAGRASRTLTAPGDRLGFEPL